MSTLAKLIEWVVLATPWILGTTIRQTLKCVHDIAYYNTRPATCLGNIMRHNLIWCVIRKEMLQARFTNWACLHRF